MELLIGYVCKPQNGLVSGKWVAILLAPGRPLLLSGLPVDCGTPVYRDGFALTR